MSSAAQPVAEGDAPLRRRRKGRWQIWVLSLLGAILALAGAALAWIDTPDGHRFVAERIGALRPASGLRIAVGRIEGSLWSKLKLHDVRLGDPDGTVLTVPVAYLDWYPVGWFSNRLDIDRLAIPSGRLERRPRLRPSGKDKPILPSFDIRLASLSIGRLDLGPDVAGTARSLRAAGRADIRAGRAIVRLDARGLDSGDQLRLLLDSRPDDNQFDLEVLAVAPGGGILAGVTGLGKPFIGQVTGKGDFRHWQGRALLALRGGRASRMALVQEAGRYAIRGTIEADALRGGLARVAAPRLEIDAAGRMVDRLVEGRATLASQAIAVTATGGIDLGRSAFDNLVVDLSLRKGQRLLKAMASDGLVVRGRLMGPFETAAYDYLLSARQASFGKTRVEGLRAEGRGRLNLRGATVLPLDIRARRISVSNPVADEILKNIHIKGTATLKGGVLSTTPIALRSAKLNGKLIILADFGRGRWTAGLTGDLGGLEIPGLGRVDVMSRIDAVSSRSGAPSVKGRARAALRRLDNAFLRGLAGGLPQVDSAIALGPDGRIQFSGLQLSAPAIRLAANGYRTRDGAFHLTGSGTHESYGPLRITLDGKIDRPHVDLLLASPMPALGLADVHAVLVPDATGYRFTAEGGSRLGPFTGAGAILLPKGRDAQIMVERLEAGGAVATGVLTPRPGGLAGQLSVTGRAEGPINFAIVEGVQQIALDLSLRRTRFAGSPRIVIGRGQIKARLLLKPGETSLSSDFEVQAFRYGQLVLGRVAGNASIVDGRGAVTVSANGRRGRQFTLLARATVAPGRIELLTGGLLDNIPFNLDRPALITQEEEDGGWRLAPATLRYRGGTLSLSGLAGGSAVEGDMQIARLPLSLFDLLNPDLGLGGLASGAIHYRQPRGGVPTGKASLTVRGLTRSGLALSSKPVDIGVNAELTEARLAMRALVANGGQVIGRAQALLSPLGGARALMDRLNPAPLNAQLRYNGDAETLWRLTNIELFGLSGSAAINADVRGTLANPSISGTVASDDAKLQSPVTGMTLTRLRSRGTFDGASLSLTEITANTAGGGSLAGAGRFTFSSERGVGIDLSARLERALVLDRDDLGATVSGPIRITSDGRGGLISGNFQVLNSRFTLGQAGSIATLPQLKVVSVNRRGREIDETAPTSPWRLDISADAPSRFAVSGLGMQSEWSLRVKIGGEVVSPRLTGTASLIRGDYDFAGKRFELREGNLLFSGETPINPTLNIRAESDVSNVSATITITGTSAKPVISFTSVPALPQEELLSRLLFGRSITNLSAPEALQLASAVGSLQGGGGLDPINAVRKAAGLSRLRILAADPTTGQKTAIAAGKNIGRHFYVELITDGEGYSATQIEYQITRWLSLLSSVSTIGRQSINLRATRDY